MSYSTFVEGDLVAIEFEWGDGMSSCSLLTLADDGDHKQPWSERCEGCAGTGVVHAAAGPCTLCWGSGRALFAFDAGPDLRAEYVPPTVAQPWLHANRPLVHA